MRVSLHEILRFLTKYEYLFLESFRRMDFCGFGNLPKGINSPR